MISEFREQKRWGRNQRQSYVKLHNDIQFVCRLERIIELAELTRGTELIREREEQTQKLLLEVTINANFILLFLNANKLVFLPSFLPYTSFRIAFLPYTIQPQLHQPFILIWCVLRLFPPPPPFRSHSIHNGIFISNKIKRQKKLTSSQRLWFLRIFKMALSGCEYLLWAVQQQQWRKNGVIVKHSPGNRKKENR